ncbi:hypothetical protein ACEN9Z_15550, partial [Stenotrophomonas geniculata]
MLEQRRLGWGNVPGNEKKPALCAGLSQVAMVAMDALWSSAPWMDHICSSSPTRTLPPPQLPWQPPLIGPLPP